MSNKPIALRPAAVALAVVTSLTATAALAQQLVVDPTKQVTPSQDYQRPLAKDDAQRMVRTNAVTRYIVELHDPAVATYKGGIAGFEPTSPKVTKVGKLSLESEPVQTYQHRLLQKQNDVFSALKKNVPELKMREHLSLVFNGMVVEVADQVSDQQNMLERLSQAPGVKRVYVDERMYTNLPTSVDLINAPEVWSELTSRADAGRDIRVAVIDSGIDSDHPMFQDNGHPAVSRPSKPDYCTSVPTFCNDKLIVARWYEPGSQISSDEVRTPEDIDGHGTHVAGTAVGNPITTTYEGVEYSFSGVAPGAHLMVYKALFLDTEGEGTGLSSNLLQAIEDAVADGADVINNSWGGGAGGDPSSSSYVSAFAAAREAGVLTVTAAGNEGPGERTIVCPGCVEDGLTIASSTHGRVYNSNTNEPSINPDLRDNISNFSSRGPNGDSSFLKPDLTAPGSDIVSAVPGGGYDSLSGTSMAAPHVAGAAALLLDKNPNWSATDLKSLLMTSAANVIRADDRLSEASPFLAGAGRLDVAAAADSFVVVDKPSIASNSCEIGCSFTRTLTNKGTTSVSFTAGFNFTDPSVEPSIDDAAFTLAPGASKTVSIDIDTRYGVSGWQFGELTFSTSSSSHPQVRLPIALLAESSDDASIVTVGETTAAPKAGQPFGLEVHGSLAETGQPVTIQVDIPAEVTLDQDSVVFNKTLSQSTQESVSADGRTITWQGTQTNAANTTAMNPATGQFFAGKTLDELLTSDPSRLCNTASCDDNQYSVDITDDGGIYLDGVRYDSLVVTTNGVVGASSNSGEYSSSALNQEIPNDAPPNGLWAPFWTDLEVGPGKGDGRINYVWVNEGENKWFVWELENAREYNDSTNTPYSFSIWFKLGTDEVYYNYIDLPTDAPDRLTVGAESGAGERGVIGIQHYYNGTGSYPSSGDVLTPVVESGERGNVKINFDLNVNLGDVPSKTAETSAGQAVTVSMADAYDNAGRTWFTYAQVSSGTQSYDAFLAQKVEVVGTMATEVVSAPSNGTATVLANGNVEYTPNTNFTGTDSFTYRGVDDDGQATNSATVTVTVTAGTGNTAPTVSASASASTAEEGDSVTLTANGNDADGDTLSYSWTQSPSSTVTLTNANSAEASFVAPEVSTDTTVTFTVTVDDGEAQATDEVTVTILAPDPVVTNTPPEAVVEEVTTAQAAGSSVSLDASGSSDADGDTLSFAWTQTAGTSVTITNANAAVASFTVPEVSANETLSFEVTVSDGEASDTATLQVAILATEPENQAPEVVVEPVTGPQPVDTTVYLDARESSDPDGDTLTFSWTKVSGPTLTINDADQARANFVVPELEVSQDAVFQVTVSDGELTATAQVEVQLQGANTAPNANANSALRRVPSGQAVTLSASSSGDPDGDTLSYLWEQIAGPTVELSSPEGEQTSFNAPTVSTETDLTFRLTVSDGLLEDTDEITISVYPRETDGGSNEDESSGSFGVWLGLLALPLIWLRRKAQR